MQTLINAAWNLHKKHATSKFLVKPSIPILFFGDLENYLKSERKIITVGLNPSNNEFPEGDSYRRFRDPASYGKNFGDSYIASLSEYFHCNRNPYKNWFGAFEPLLNGLNCSFYDDRSNTALHTDLCSPLATDPTWNELWNELPESERVALFNDGRELWEQLVKILCPDMIIMSIAQKYVKAQFPKGEWEIVSTLQITKAGKPRKKPFHVCMKTVQLNDKATRIVFGQAANTPFGTVSKQDKIKIGEALKSYLPRPYPNL